METIPLEMDDIFDENDDDDIAPSRLPDLDDLDLEGGLEPMRDSRFDESNEQGDGDEEAITDNPELLNKLKSLKGASKNVARRSFIKLDAARLTGERGIPALPKIFKDVKLKGKHHESEDLKTVMHHLEHWAHRLFPKMTFAEVLERSERLGAKKEVQTCVKRIRLGMPVLATEVEDEEDVQREGDAGVQQEEEAVVHREENLNDIFSQVPDDDEIDELLSTENEINQASSQKQNAGPQEQNSNPSENTSADQSGLSEEVRLRIERNKRLALERRAARLAQATSVGQNVQPSLPSSSDVTLEGTPQESDCGVKDTEFSAGDEDQDSSQKISMTTGHTEDNEALNRSENDAERRGSVEIGDDNTDIAKDKHLEPSCEENTIENVQG